jgi:TonB family protein
MFISRQLRMALLISFLWHLICVSFVSIVFLPGGYKLRKYSSVHFLGSILRSPITIEQFSDANWGDYVLVPSEVDIQKENHFNESPNISLPAEKKILSPDSFIDVDVHRETLPSRLSFVSKEASQPERKIVFQPSSPHYPEWVQQEFRGSFAKFTIYISSCGLVEQLICVQASGNPEIDTALARYIEKWRFAPVAGLEGQWQTVKIDIK